MSAEDILTILDSIATYIIYFYPGYITLYIYYFLKAKTLQDEKGTVAKAIVLSFLYKTCVDRFLNVSDIRYHVMLILIAIIVPYIAHRLQKSSVLRNIFNALGIDISMEENEIDILDTGEFSSWLKVYLRDSELVYEGYLGDRELESGKKRFISLKKYRKYILDTNGKPSEPYIEENETDDDIVIIYYDDIERIEKKNIEM